MTKKKRVSDVITDEEVLGWNSGDIVTIKAGTGAGKSYFIKNKLYEQANKTNKKILMLIHRTNCVDQFEEEVSTDNKQNTIHVMTYQKIEYIYSLGGTFDFSPYSYINCDEFHYFMSDASFSKTTDISLNAILKQTHAIKIFMSATGDYMKRYISNVKKIKTIDYELDINFDFIEFLKFYNSDEAVETYIDECIDSDDKMIIFMQSSSKALALHQKYKNHTLFNCGKGSTKEYKHVDEDKIKKMLLDEKFEEKILITTTVMDAGVNIQDKDVKHIVMDVEDLDVMTQCLGRRRINYDDSGDTIGVYIKNISNNQLGGRITQINKRIKKARFFRDYGDIEYVKMYGRDPDGVAIVYEMIDENGQVVKKVNELMLFKSMTDIVRLQDMIEHGYITVVSTLFNQEYKLEEESKNKMHIEEYLDSIVGERQYGQESKNTLASTVNLRDGRTNRIVKSIKTISSHVKDLYNSKYIISSDTDWRRVLDNGDVNTMRGKSYWIVFKE